MRLYGVKNGLGGKYHLVASEETERHLEDPAYNTAPLNDSGLCGRLDPKGKYPHVLSRDYMIKSGLCGDCLRLEGAANSKTASTTRV